jgi:hypothetical protein
MEKREGKGMRKGKTVLIMWYEIKQRFLGEEENLHGR